MKVRGGAGPLLVFLVACQVPPPATVQHASTRTAATADVVSVGATGMPGAYRFDVGVQSPDRGCDQYADWWEVMSQDGRLLYRRVLSHSHVEEQPFTRSGEPVPVEAGAVVWVRAHMHPTGYGGTAFTGSVRDGFRATDLPVSFAADAAEQPPRPPECRF
jgi:hypothetical protein